jgi:uncharacterized protein DUF4249
MTSAQHNIMYFTGQMVRRLPGIMLILIVSVGFWQCDAPIELDYSGFQAKLVINAQVSPEGQFIVSVTTSTTPVSAKEGDVPDGVKVTLTDISRGIDIPLYRENDLFYASNQVKPIPGSEYVFRAEAPGFVAVEATTRIPEELNLVSFEVSDFVIKPSDVTPNKTNVSYKLELDFGIEEDAYLHLIFRQHSRIKSGAVGTPVYEDLLYSINPQFPEESGYISHVEDGILISLAEVVSNPLVFSFVDFTIDALSEELGNVQVEVRTVSPEYYLYFVSLSRQLISSQDPFAEPIQVFSNVDGGLGNFSSYSVTFYEIALF